MMFWLFMLRLPPILAVLAMLKLLNVPTLVMLGCALVYTVPAISALATWPVTLAPVIELSPDPLPLMLLPVTLPVAEKTPVPDKLATRTFPPYHLKNCPPSLPGIPDHNAPASTPNA